MTLGVAFAGGGVRGSGELGLMQAFYEEGIKPTVFAGTSAGSIVATLLALGSEPKEAFEKFQAINSHLLDVAYGKILESITFHHLLLGFVKGDRLENLLDNVFESKAFRDVKYPLGMVTTELSTGTRWDFMSGIEKFQDVRLSKAVHMSCAFPIVFEPVGFDGKLFVDGGLVANVPSDLSEKLGANQILTIDLGYDHEKSIPTSIVGVAMQSFNIIEMTANQDNTSRGIYINPQVRSTGLFDFSQIQNLYDDGYSYGKKIAPDILKQLQG